MPNHNPWQIPGMSNVLLPGATTGQILYVDTAANGGLDANDGTTPYQPKVSIDNALASCDDDTYDTIVVMNHDNANCPAFPIVVDINKVTIVAVPGGSYFPRQTGAAIIDSGEAIGMSLTAEDTRIIGFEFQPGSQHAGISIASTDCYAPGVYNCKFLEGQEGIHQTDNNMPRVGMEIAHNLFVAQTATCILHNNAAGYTWIHHNHFQDCTLGISLTGTGSQGTRITNNTFGLHSDGAGDAITLGANTLLVFVDRNSAVFGETAVAMNNPYLDSAAANANYWGRNYWGEVVTVPG